MKETPPSERLVSLKAITNGALASDQLPTRIKLLNYGINQTVIGNVLVDDRTITALAASQAQSGFDRIALDFEHNTVPGSPEFERTKEPREVAGYGAPEVVRGDGLYLSAITWTDSGRANAKNFADLSPTPRLDAEGRVVFLHSVALCRNGAVHGLSFFSAPATPVVPTAKKSMTEAELSAAIASALKPLSETLTALSAEVTTLKAAKPAAPVFEIKDGDKTVTLSAADVAGKIVALESAQTATVKAVDAAQKADVIKRFAAEGKVPLGEDGKPMTDAQLADLPLGVLKMLHATCPKTVPLSAKARGAGDNTPKLEGMAAVRSAIQADLAKLNAA